MSLAPGGAAVAATVMGIVPPLVLAHYGRPPGDRLPALPAVSISVATVAVGILGLYGLWPIVLGRTPLHVTGLYGVLIGLSGLIGYGVVERLVVPWIDRFRSSGTDR